MSDKDQFPEPEGRDERTIFRPGPPARRAAGAPQEAAPQEAAAPPRAEADGAPDPREMTQVHNDDHTVFRPNPAGRRPPARQPAPAPEAVPPPPRKASVQSADLAAPDANPITQAASPLLLLLGRLRAALLRAPGQGLVAQIASGIE